METHNQTSLRRSQNLAVSLNSQGKCEAPVSMLGFDEFIEIMAPVVAYCVDDMDKDLARIYYAKLQDLIPGAFQAAVNHWLATSEDRWIPTIGELRGLALDFQHGRRMHWLEAWGKIIDAANVFSEHSMAQSDSARQIVGNDLMPFVRSLGGFFDIKYADSKTISVMQSNFRDAYTRTEREKAEQRKLPEGMKIPHKVIVQHVAGKLGLPAPEVKK